MYITVLDFVMQKTFVLSETKSVCQMSVELASFQEDGVRQQQNKGAIHPILIPSVHLSFCAV